MWGGAEYATNSLSSWLHLNTLKPLFSETFEISQVVQTYLAAFVCRVVPGGVPQGVLPKGKGHQDSTLRLRARCQPDSPKAKVKLPWEFPYPWHLGKRPGATHIELSLREKKKRVQFFFLVQSFWRVSSCFSSCLGTGGMTRGRPIIVGPSPVDHDLFTENFLINKPQPWTLVPL